MSDDVREKTEASFTELNLNENIFMLIKNDECPGYMASKCDAIFETVIAGQLLEGVDWQMRNLADSNVSGFKLKLTKIEVGKAPNFADMKPMVLYKPPSKIYPAVDMMYTTNEGVLYGLQVTRDKSKKIKTSAVDKWLKSIDWGDNMDKVRIAVIPRPEFAGTFKAAYVGDSKGYPQFEVWKVPPKYGRSF